jgi:Rad3-related DNA helicase
MTANESIFESICPADLGLPPKFPAFRLSQRQALDWENEATEPLLAACLPTGSGKTLFAAAAAKFHSVKAVYLCATISLQAQVMNDFAPAGMVSISGRANYTCPNYGTCAEGYDESCSLHQTNRCPYTRAVERAKDSDLIVTNYAYWLHARKHNPSALERDGGRPVELLICDEAHNIEQQLTGYAEVKLYASETGKHAWPRDGIMDNALAPAAGHPSGPIFEWAHKEIVRLKDSSGDEDKDLLDRCRRIVRMNPNWVWQFSEHDRHVTFSPIRLSKFTSSLLSGVPRVLLMSASLNEFVLRLLLPSDAVYSYRSWPAVFPPQNAPVYHIPTRKLSWKSTEEDYEAVIAAADKIIDSRCDRKGIIHSVSYARARRAVLGSRHRDRFIWNESGGQLQASLDRFRRAGPGVVLVTPSVAEGFDFPAEQCEYGICLKFPFPNEMDRVTRERCGQIPGYRLHAAAQKIVQMRGRPIRSETDKAELFILDNAVRQLTGAEGRSYCPPGFRIFTVNEAPAPPPRIAVNAEG